MRRRFMNSPNTPININDYLTIEALEDGLYVYLSVNSCEYCIDGDGNWKSLPDNVATNPLKKGQTLSLRGNLTPNSFVGIGHFTISKSCNLKGNVMSMLFGDKAKDNYNLYGYDYAFYGLFYYCTTIKTVSNNFLPATTLASYCYHEMFSRCTSLTTAPELPATTLTNGCYDSMFSGCTKLNYIKMLATHILTTDCLYRWVDGVAPTGTFVKNPAMTSLPTGVSGIPSGWTVVNDGEESSGKIVNNIYQSFVDEGRDLAFIITSEYPVTSQVVIYDGSGSMITGIAIGNTKSSKYYMSVDTTSTYISPTEDDTYIYNLVKD